MKSSMLAAPTPASGSAIDLYFADMSQVPLLSAPAERALTIGRQKLNFGANYQHSTYDTFEGKSLDDDSIKFYLTHQSIGTVSTWETRAASIERSTPLPQ